MKFIAHSATQQHPDGHGLSDHLFKVAERASACFDHPFLMQGARLAGLYHDAGKFKPNVQHHIRHSTTERIDHATLGARLVRQACAPPVFPLLAAAMLGHHGGMPDYVHRNGERTCAEARLNRASDEAELQAESAFFSQMDVSGAPLLNTLPPVTMVETLGMEAYMAGRMLHSALVDADYLDTEEYFDPEKASLRGGRPALSTLLPVFQAHMEQLAGKSTAKIAPIRGEILGRCIQAASGPQGIYTLSVPTGGGKTLASMGFALHHAEAHKNIRRVIYAIPFTSVTEQNARVFREVFGPEAVLEHHSAMVPPEEGKPTDHAAENWDAPVVVTTNVQLFETIFSNKPSKSRKLHNMQNSLIVLDEMQALSDEVLKPCLAALDALAQNYGVTVVLSTATQPKYDGVWPKRTQVTEIIEDPQALYEALRRTRVVQLGTLEDDALLDHLREQEQALCIVNTRDAARNYAQALGTEQDGVFHLSTMMCPKHRLKKLNQIRAILADKGNPHSCRVVSTSLIEAGVDVDFPVVFRETAGLDSVAQAAGRCNRSGDRGISPVYLFSTVGKRQPSESRRLASITLNEVAPLFEEDLLSIDALSAYFKIRFGAGKDLDAQEVLKMIKERKDTLFFPYETIAGAFEMIKSGSESVFVPYDEEGKRLIDELEQNGVSRELMRSLQPYAASVYPNQLAELGKRVQNRDGVLVLDVGAQGFADVYSESFGLIVDAPPMGYFT